MYLEHFALRARPFRAGIDRVAYYPATTHEEAIGRLRQAILDDEGLCLLTGEPGTGKTLLCHCLLERLGESVNGIFLTNTHFPDRASLLQAICFDLSLPFENKSEQELRLAVTEALLASYSAGRRVVLVVDEAHLLNVEHLEEFRMLANLESETAKTVQVVFSALPEFMETLQLPRLRAFRQRLAVRVHLEPLGAQEAAELVVHQLRVAGARTTEVFTDEAIETLARATAGNPRRINQTAHLALCLAQGIDAAQVDVEAVLEALVILHLDAPSADHATGLESSTGSSAALPPKASRGRRRAPAIVKPDRRPA
jgi:type II secretory pathway predicted ATPase ExeA